MTMSLQEKGAIQSPPVLSGPVEATSKAIQAWPGVVAAPHWDLYRRTTVNGAEFHVGDEDLGHLHLDGEVHLATSRVLREPLVAAGFARPFRYGSGSYDGWVEASVRTPVEAAHATWLFRLNYDRLQGLPLADLLARIADHAR